MQSDLRPTAESRAAANLALARHLAFGSLFASVVAFIVALALDLTSLVPLMAGQRVYDPIREFLSYQVDGQMGQLMTGVFLLLAVAAWSYAAAAILAPRRTIDRLTLAAAGLFGIGLFVGACFRAVPTAELAVTQYLKSVSRLHTIGIGGGFVPAMLAAFRDQRRIVFGRIPGFALTKLSFWLVAGGALFTAAAMLAFPAVAGLAQRVFVTGIVLWLATEAHQLFWISAETSYRTPTPLDD